MNLGNNPDLYDDNFFQSRKGKTTSSSEIVVPLILQLFQPTSVVDVGCGTGEWLESFAARGISDYLGIDGDHVPEKLLRIPVANFIRKDLSKGFDLGRKFDIAMTLEVAEHLPEHSANAFVDSLVRSSDLVIFSAAIPHQGGHGHINEQWPEYWAKLFLERGYRVYDPIRDRIWHDLRIAYHYSQNTLVFAKPEMEESHPCLGESSKRGDVPVLSRVHPVKWNRSRDLTLVGLRRILAVLPGLLINTVRKRLNFR